MTNAVFVPTILQMLTSVPGAAERDYSALRSIAYGASPITTPVLKAALGPSAARCSASTGSPRRPVASSSSIRTTTTRTARASTSCAPPGAAAWMELRIVDPPQPRLLPGEAARCGCAART